MRKKGTCQDQNRSAGWCSFSCSLWIKFLLGCGHPNKVFPNPTIRQQIIWTIKMKVNNLMWLSAKPLYGHAKPKGELKPKTVTAFFTSKQLLPLISSYIKIKQNVTEIDNSLCTFRCSVDHYNAELILYKPWRSKRFNQFEIMINGLISSF